MDDSYKTATAVKTQSHAQPGTSDYVRYSVSSRATTPESESVFSETNESGCSTTTTPLSPPSEAHCSHPPLPKELQQSYRKYLPTSDESKSAELSTAEESEWRPQPTEQPDNRRNKAKQSYFDIPTWHSRRSLSDQSVSSPSQLDESNPSNGMQQAKPSIQLKVEKKPERSWHGNINGPAGSKSTNDDTADEDYGAQAAAPVQVLPPLPTHHSRPVIEPQPRQGLLIGRTEKDAEAIVFPTTQMIPKARLVDIDGKLRKQGRRKILLQKHGMQAFQLSFNGILIFATWWWTRYYYILLPLITAIVALNIFMIISLIFRKTWNTIRPEKIEMPATPESLVFLVPCYNETKEELTRSINSLVNQRNVSNHNQAIVIVCDGKVRGRGMSKTTADYLLQDILVYKTERKYIQRAYTAWDQQPMDVVIQRGTYQGVPYYCIIKQQNQGKRDGLIGVRSLLYNFNRRDQAPSTIFSPQYFDDFCAFLLNDAGITNVVHLIGMDADTVFDDDCIDELLKQSRYPKTVGVCGYVSVDWQDGRWNLWRLYQSAEYTIAQGLRRLHQSMVTHKVSCLPGCCQLLRICEETCGDEVLVEKFGYCPDITDGLLTNIRATASEDRNHVCHMLSARPQSQTRQALRAKAYTDVPRSWSVFLSQRRRWTLGATSNDLMLITASGVNWFERILAAVNVSTWLVNPFIFASLASMIFAFAFVPAWIVLCFVGVMVIPIVYYLTIPFWLCRNWIEWLQFYAGTFIYIFGGPFINIAVLIYASIYMDSFGWGKTRKTITEKTSSENLNELERLDRDSNSSSTSNLPEHGAQPLPAQANAGGNSDVGRSRDAADEERRLGF